MGAKVAAAVSDCKTLDRGTADRAGLAAKVSNTEVELGCAQFAIRTFIRVDAGAFAVDSRR